MFTKSLQTPRRSHLWRKEHVGFIVPVELLGLRVELQLSPDGHCDVVEVTNRGGVVADFGGGERLLAAFDGVEESADVARVDVVVQAFFVEAGARPRWISSLPIWDFKISGLLASNCAAVNVDEDPTFVPLELDAAGAFGRSDQFQAAGVRVRKLVVPEDVVVAFAADALGFDFDGQGVVGAGAELADVDDVRRGR